MASQTDAKGQQVELSYDALNRLVRRYYAVAWASDVVAGASRPNVYDLMELRAAVDTDRFAAALALPRPYNWTDPEVVAGRDVRVRVPHFNDLRSPDTMVPDPGNPQAMNRYSYVLRNPLRFSDPSGHAREDDFAAAHGGKAPSDHDRFDFTLSSASGYTWTDDDWNKTYSDRQELWSDFTASNDVGPQADEASQSELESLVDPSTLSRQPYRPTRALEWGPAPGRTGTIGVGAQWSGAGLGWSGQVQLLLVSAPHEFGMTVTAGAGGGAALPGAAS